MLIKDTQQDDYFFGRSVLQLSGLNWTSPARTVKLQNSELHLWRANLDTANWPSKILYDSLSGDEKNRTENMHQDSSQRRFVISRALLRNILACYLGLNPDEIEFSYGPNGKPALKASHQTNIEFNLSHSEHMFLLGLNLNYPLGVDLEVIKPSLNFIDLSRRVFSQQIYRKLSSLTTEKQYNYFFQNWTLKEAYLKALGKGLNSPYVEQETLANTLKISDTLQQPQNTEWLNLILTPETGFAAAIVLNSLNYPSLNHFQLKPFDVTADFLNITL